MAHFHVCATSEYEYVASGWRGLNFLSPQMNFGLGPSEKKTFFEITRSQRSQHFWLWEQKNRLKGKNSTS